MKRTGKLIESPTAVRHSCTVQSWLHSLVLLTVVASAASSAQSPTAEKVIPHDREIYVERYSAAAATASAQLTALRKSLNAPGLSAAVAINGKLVWAETVGFSDLAQQTPFLRTTALRIGSTSKALTSVALGKVVESGQLDLDAPIQRYVPSFPQKLHKVTARHLAGHQAGIRHYNRATDEYWNRERFKTVVAPLKVFKDDPLLFEPGTGYSYSTYGFTLLSAAIEAAAAKDFLSFMHDAVFVPTGMRHTEPDLGTQVPPAVSLYFVRSPWTGAIKEAQKVDNSNKWAGGGFVSTSTDLVRLGVALLDATILKPETVALLTTPQRLRSGEENGEGYAMGWRSGETRLPVSGRSVRRIHHGGVAMGATSFLALMPEQRLVVALNSNLHTHDFAEFASETMRLAEIFLALD